MRKIIAFSLLWISFIAYSQEDSIFVSRIAREALSNRTVMNHLKFLCDSTPGRLMGSQNSLKAISYLKSNFERMYPDTSFLLEYKTNSWEHKKTIAKVTCGKKEIVLRALALGPSISTDNKFLSAEIAEVSSFDEIQKLGKEKIKGKIVFINQPMPDTFLQPFEAYRVAIKGRLYGSPEAAKYGAVGTVIRSLTQITDTFPHTGKTVYIDTIQKTPIAALSSSDADQLHNLLLSDPHLQFKLFIDGNKLENIHTANIIVDIKGSEKPDEYILFGAHIDSWYNTQGAHDDGVGCAQALEIMRIFKKLGYKNKHTIRFVLFMDEELSQTGADQYALYTHENKLNHIAAIESDAGALSPRNINVDAANSVIEQLNKFQKLFQPYGLYSFSGGSTDVDVERLKKFGVPLFGNKPYNQRYFDYHHSAYDTYDKVNFRDLQLNTINLAALIYLIDKYGL